MSLIAKEPPPPPPPSKLSIPSSPVPPTIKVRVSPGVTENSPET